jgi:hypothetical protein
MSGLTEHGIEQYLQDKGLTAPRVTPQDLDELITAERYHTFPGTTLTVCCLTLANGFYVTGETACASPENFDEELGNGIARMHARDRIWLLEGYLLKQRLHESARLEQVIVDDEDLREP